MELLCQAVNAWQVCANTALIVRKVVEFEEGMVIKMGFEVLLKGNNMLRLLQGLGVALQISLISVCISIVFGIMVGMLMTHDKRGIKAVTRAYLEIVRIMPQMVLLFIVYFGATKALGLNLSAEVSSIIVFSFWGTAEMADLVRGALISIPHIQYQGQPFVFRQCLPL